ncbi:hypothetical protein GE061_004909 [Apolygus lucorum]|uniref:EGF-like domain-containing protein n=1 Tax=Apolygus lucorum TaxID=248454 RepID=A0A8S9WXD4_APOLU|nr:hypothetical protein GE061_004909 [Apolygus lucorum]
MTLRRHLGHFYLIILMVYLEVESGEHLKNTSNKLKKDRHQKSPGSSLLRSDGLGGSSDQFKWPWKSYDEWKRSQEQIENEIDQILISGGKMVHGSNRTKIPNGKRRRLKFGSNRSRKRAKKPNVKKLPKRRRMKKTRKKEIQKTIKPVEEAAEVTVKYYSTDNKVSTSFEKFETFIGAFTTESSLRSGGIHQSRWKTKHIHGNKGCTINNGGCEGLCVQTKTSSYCHCPDGFRLDSSGRKCLDLNECLSRNGHGRCQGECVNEWGSFKCGCDSIPGTLLDVDGVTCVPVDHCVDTDCSHICINTRSGAFCSCPEGYTLDNDWKTCKEVPLND